MTNMVKMHSENTDKISMMSNQPSYNYPSKFYEHVERKSTEIHNKTANINIKTALYP